MLYGVIMFSVVLTAVYMFRLYFLTFHGEFRGTAHQKDHAHESPISMTLPLMVLAVLSVFGGLLNLPGLFLHQGAHWLNHYLSGAAGLGLIEHPEAAVNTTLLLMGVASAVSITVLIWAYITYAKQGSLAKADSDLKGWELLSSKKLYLDELYHALITKPAEWLGEQLKQVIEISVNPVVPNAIKEIRRSFLAGAIRVATNPVIGISIKNRIRFSTLIQFINR